MKHDNASGAKKKARIDMHRRRAAVITARLRVKPMTKNRARSFVTIMIVIAASVFFLRMIISTVLDATIAQNESYASDNLKLISAALEAYAKDRKGIYPTNFSLLTGSRPAYLETDFIAQSPLKGYSYSCPRLESAGYGCTAVPFRCRLTGNRVFTVISGGKIAAEDCVGQEQDI